MSVPQQIVLGSASVWRAKVLKDAGIPFTVRSADIDEKAIRHVQPATLVYLLSKAKAEAIMPTLTEPAFLITSDQVVVFKGEIREKAVDAAQAEKWMREYRGNVLFSVTGVRVTDTSTRNNIYEASIVKITVSDKMTDEEIRDAIGRGNVLGSCGALVREDPAYMTHITEISGDGESNSLELETSIQGLPILTAKAFLKQLGWQEPEKK